MRSRRGFSIVETVVTLVLIGALMAVVAPRLLGRDTVGTDMVAKQSLGAALDAQLLAVHAGGAPSASPAVLGPFAPEVTFTTDVSTGPATVSVATVGAVVGLAAASGDTCWWVRRDFGSVSTTPPTLYAYRASTSGRPCAAAEAIALTVDVADPERGRSWQRPLTVG